MYVDSYLRFCNALLVSATSVNSDSIDLSVVRNIGAGSPLIVVVQVVTAITTQSVTATLQVDTSAPETYTPDATQTLGVFTAGSAPAGTQIIQYVSPQLLIAGYRGMRIQFTGSATPAGAVTAFLTTDVDNWTPYADSISIV